MKNVLIFGLFALFLIGSVTAATSLTGRLFTSPNISIGANTINFTTGYLEFRPTATDKTIFGSSQDSIGFFGFDSYIKTDQYYFTGGLYSPATGFNSWYINYGSQNGTNVTISESSPGSILIITGEMRLKGTSSSKDWSFNVSVPLTRDMTIQENTRSGGAGTGGSLYFRPRVGAFVTSAIGTFNSTNALFNHVNSSQLNTTNILFYNATLLATPIPGTMEWGDNLYATKKTAIREALSGVIFTQTQAINASGASLSTQTLIGTGVGTIVLPANFWTKGKTIRITARGVHTIAGTASIRFRVNTTDSSSVEDTYGDSGVFSDSVNSQEAWMLESIITCYTPGSSGTLWAQGTVLMHEGLGTSNILGMENMVVTTVDTTKTGTLDVEVQWSGVGADANDWITLTNLVVEVLN